MVEAGTFRADLFYRLNVFRHRTCRRCASAARTSPVLADQLLAALVAAHRASRWQPLDREAVATLCAHAWPGNVRELENTLERALILARGRARHARRCFPFVARRPPPRATPRRPRRLATGPPAPAASRTSRSSAAGARSRSA